MKNDILGVIIVVILLACFGLFLSKSPEEAPGFGQTELAGGSIEVVEPTDTTQVTVKTEFFASGFLTVHESMGSAPGNTIGVSRYIEPAMYNQLTIFTDTEMIPGNNYIILMHVDDGDKSFDLRADTAVTVNGEVVRADFEVPSSEE